MAIKDVIDIALNTKWTITDNFEVDITNPKVVFWEPTEMGTIIQKSLLSIDVPTLTSPESDYVIGGERRLGVKIFEAFRFTMRFRDFEGGQLRRYFEAIWIAQQYEYFDNIKTSVKIDSILNLDLKKNIFRTEDALITEVSSIQFDNTSTQIAEFSVAFIANKISDELVTKFGEHTFIENFKDTLKFEEEYNYGN